MEPSAVINAFLAAYRGIAGLRVVHGPPANEGVVQVLLRLNTDNDNSLVSRCTRTLVARHVVMTAANCMATANTMAFIGAMGGSNSGAVISVSKVFKDTEYSCDPEGLALKHNFAIIVFASHTRSWACPMRDNNNPSVPRLSLFTHFVSYSRTYSNHWVNNSPSQYPHQVDVSMNLGSDCANSYAHGDSHIDNERQVSVDYAQSGCNTWQGGSGWPLLQYGASG